MERILRINELHVITEDVVEAARSTLVIGAGVALKIVRQLSIQGTG